MFSKLGLGLGLRPSHYADIFSGQTQVSWFEAVTENYLGIVGATPGPPLVHLEKIRADRPIVLHGVSLSIGSTDPLNFTYLKNLKRLIERVQPSVVSDHLCWTGVEGENLHDLLPLPYREDTIEHLVTRIDQVQDYIGRRLVIENVSAYLNFSHSEMTEWQFLSELARRADCGILLDINNIYVSSVNQGFSAREYIDAIPRDRVAYMHLAGHSNLGTHLIDTHDHPVAPEVWELYRYAARRFGRVSTMVEWDADIPEFSVLQNEVLKAQKIQDEVCGGLNEHVSP